MPIICSDCAHSFQAEDVHFCPMCGAPIPEPCAEPAGAEPEAAESLAASEPRAGRADPLFVRAGESAAEAGESSGPADFDVEPARAEDSFVRTALFARADESFVPIARPRRLRARSAEPGAPDETRTARVGKQARSLDEPRARKQALDAPRSRARKQALDEPHRGGPRPDLDDEWLRPHRRSYRSAVLAAGALALVIATWTIARATAPAAPAPVATVQPAPAPAAPAVSPIVPDEPAAVQPAPEVVEPPPPPSETARAHSTRRPRRPSQPDAPAPVKAGPAPALAADDGAIAAARAQLAALALLGEGAATDRAPAGDPPAAANPGEGASAAGAIEPGSPAESASDTASPDSAPAAAETVADSEPQPAVEQRSSPAWARARFFVKLGQAQLARGQTADAETSFARALDLEPGNAEARAGLAEARSRSGAADAASAQLE